jgi:hypothetical protein
MHLSIAPIHGLLSGMYHLDFMAAALDSQMTPVSPSQPRTRRAIFLVPFTGSVALSRFFHDRLMGFPAISSFECWAYLGIFLSYTSSAPMFCDVAWMLFCVIVAIALSLGESNPLPVALFCPRVQSLSSAGVFFMFHFVGAFLAAKSVGDPKPFMQTKQTGRDCSYGVGMNDLIAI